MPTSQTNVDGTCEARVARTLAAIRSEVAIVRSLADEVERIVPSTSPKMAVQQLAEELTRLGIQLLAATSALRAATEETCSRDASRLAVV